MTVRRSAPRSVMVAMSGGVDSSVAAALLVEAGHEVVGVTMKLHSEPAPGGPKAGCCTVDDAEDARSVAAALGISHYMVNLSAEFTAAVMDAYSAAYASGRTPNPCVECNRLVKFDELLARADLLGIDAVATGHHARLSDGSDASDSSGTAGSPRLRRGYDRSKDQSYVLACVNPSHLGRLLFPIGTLTKDRVRRIAEGLGLRTARKAESMEVCFLPGGKEAFLSARLDLDPGDVLDREGTVVGRHRGAALYTIGQRRGLGVAAGAPVFVEAVDVSSNTIHVAPTPPACEVLSVVRTVWYRSPPLDPLDVEVQTSAHGAPRRARVVAAEGGGAASVRLDGPVPTPAPGQLAVFYEGDEVVGSGEVVSATHAETVPFR